MWLPPLPSPLGAPSAAAILQEPRLVAAAESQAQRSVSSAGTSPPPEYYWELAVQAAAEANTLLKYHPSIGVQVVIGGTGLALEQKRMQADSCQVMVPYNFTEFHDSQTSKVQNNVILMSQINDVVTRILRIKFVMGLFDNQLTDNSLANQVGSREHRELAREAVRKSQVLLKNNKSMGKPLILLPKKDSRRLSREVMSTTWAINVKVGQLHATMILNAVKSTVHPDSQVVYNGSHDSNFMKSNNFAYAIIVVGELPYVETFSAPGPSTISNVCGSVMCVLVIISGCPVVIELYVLKVDAPVAAWLPGTEGQGVTDLPFGDYGFTGKLARTWFRSVDQLPMNVGDLHYHPLYPFGFGLTTKGSKECNPTYS